MRRARRRTVVISAILFLGVAAGGAQELTPRFYWPAPKGTRVAVVGFAYSAGDVLMDPSLPIYDVDSSISTGIVAYLQTFSLWGRTTNVVVELPYSQGVTKGLLLGDPARRDTSGFGDLGVTLAVNLLGAPSLTLTDFQELRAHPRPILGASIKLLAPTGHYDTDRLVNVGTNRWSVKPELGTVIPVKPKWLLEFKAGVWFFGDDDDFLAGERKQDPIFNGQAHLVKRFRPGFWASLSLNWYTGGQQTIGGSRLIDLQRNSRAGVTVVVPFHGRHAIKVGYSRGFVTEFGTDFDQFLVSYQKIL